jgi:DNA-binding NarL/FixJ family response regulator
MADDVSHSQIERALEAGADGYTLKDIGTQELEQAIGRLAAGDTVLHPEAASALAQRFTANGSRSVPLTPRQREILRLIASGLENKQIARKLGIGVHTVKTHVSRVLHKLGAQSRTEAVVLALRDRLIS